MTFQLNGRSNLLRLNVGPKAVLGAALLIGINTAAGYWSLTRDFNLRAVRDIDISLRTLTLAFGEAYPDAKITLRGDRIVIPKMPKRRSI